MTMPDEVPEIRLKRLRMRSVRRGIREMDIVLGDFARLRLEDLDPAMLDVYEDLLEENDHDLYGWVSGQLVAPVRYLDLITRIVELHSGRKT